MSEARLATVRAYSMCDPLFLPILVADGSSESLHLSRTWVSLDFARTSALDTGSSILCYRELYSDGVRLAEGVAGWPNRSNSHSHGPLTRRSMMITRNGCSRCMEVLSAVSVLTYVSLLTGCSYNPRIGASAMAPTAFQS